MKTKNIYLQVDLIVSTIVSFSQWTKKSISCTVFFWSSFSYLTGLRESKQYNGPKSNLLSNPNKSSQTKYINT